MGIDTWHFTLSALAQSLAAILGLTTIFVALKLEHIVKEIDYYKRRGASILKVHPDKKVSHFFFTSSHISESLHRLREEHKDNMDPLLPHLAKMHKKYEPSIRVSAERSTHFFEDTIFFLDDYRNQKKLILKTIRLPALITISDIVIALFFLAVSDQIFTLVPWNEALLVAVVLWGIMGIVAIAGSSYQILSSVE